MPTFAAQTQTVLVVDDDPGVLSLCRTLLERAGFSVLPAAGSSEALKICKHHSGTIDIMVTDLVLPPPEFSFASGGNEFPHVHGHELAVRALGMRDNLRILLMSGNVEKDLAGYGIRKGSLPFISKPFDNVALIDLVRRTLQEAPPTKESLLQEHQDKHNGTDEWFD
ncbi:putative Response Regulator [Nitrospira japonica]|uniref:Putative Response Regulator n=1 Tax=Nitrospira japonica TaxID=1325564 RepID=A0A1W1HZZ4_9BACT|nr:response regulator [Nitrospira japonica]SLM46328.1 putative Response Regulator [Nitrospira japonica]